MATQQRVKKRIMHCVKQSRLLLYGRQLANTIERSVLGDDAAVATATLLLLFMQTRQRIFKVY